MMLGEAGEGLRCGARFEQRSQSELPVKRVLSQQQTLASPWCICY